MKYSGLCLKRCITGSFVLPLTNHHGLSPPSFPTMFWAVNLGPPGPSLPSQRSPIPFKDCTPSPWLLPTPGPASPRRYIMPPLSSPSNATSRHTFSEMVWHSELTCGSKLIWLPLLSLFTPASNLLPSCCWFSLSHLRP